MKKEKLSFAKKPLLERCAEGLFTAYEMLSEYDEEDIREFLNGEITLAAVGVVSGIKEELIINEVVKQAKRSQLEDDNF
jgi:hypothetical protein